MTAGEVTLAPDPRPAWQYIVEAVKAAPGEITLVTIGPLTNLALALQEAPEITGLVKQVVVMGGAFGVNGHRGNVTPYAEANIHDDPDAADRVFTADWPVVIIGLDVTQQSFFSSAYLDALRDDAGEPGRFLWDVSRFYLRFYSERIGLDGCHVHDPSAIAYVIDPTLFTLREGRYGSSTRGLPSVTPCRNLTACLTPTTAGPIIVPSRSGWRCGIRRCWRSIGRRWWPGAAAARALGEQGGLRPGLRRGCDPRQTIGASCGLYCPQPCEEGEAGWPGCRCWWRSPSSGG